MAEPRMIDPGTVLNDFSGKPMVKILKNDEEPAPLTLRRCIQFMMETPLQTDSNADFKTKMTWFKIGEKCEQTVTSFSAKETDTILERASKFFGALIVGRMAEVLDPEPDSK